MTEVLKLAFEAEESNRELWRLRGWYLIPFVFGLIVGFILQSAIAGVIAFTPMMLLGIYRWHKVKSNRLAIAYDEDGITLTKVNGSSQLIPWSRVTKPMVHFERSVSRDEYIVYYKDEKDKDRKIYVRTEALYKFALEKCRQFGAENPLTKSTRQI